MMCPITGESLWTEWLMWLIFNKSKTNTPFPSAPSGAPDAKFMSTQGEGYPRTHFPGQVCLSTWVFFLVVILLRFGLFFFLLFNSFMKILVSPKTEKKGRYWNEGKNVKSTQLMLWRSAWKHENQNHALMNVQCGPHGTDVADRWTFWLREWSPFYSHNRGA